MTRRGRRKRKWMAKAFSEHKGALHRDLGVPENKTIPAGKLDAATHADSATVRHRAQLAETARRMHSH